MDADVYMTGKHTKKTDWKITLLALVMLRVLGEGDWLRWDRKCTAPYKVKPVYFLSQLNQSPSSSTQSSLYITSLLRERSQWFLVEKKNIW